MSDTPRTDAETMRDEYDHVDTEFGAFAPSNTVSADFARQLERELAEAKELLHIAGGFLSTMPQFENHHPLSVLICLKNGKLCYESSRKD